MPVFAERDQWWIDRRPCSVSTNTYLNSRPETARKAAQPTADMIIKAANAPPGPRHGETTVTHVMT